MITEDQIIALKEQVDEAKTQVAELTGQQTAILRQIKEEFACKSIKEARAKAEKLRENLTSIDTQIEESCKELEEKYDFD